MAADRNRTIQTMTDQARSVCAMLTEISITKSIYMTHKRPEPGTFLDKQKLDAYTAEIVLNAKNAEKEGRFYYDAQKVRERKISEEFRVAYTTAYTDFRSAAQTVRLWIDDEDAESLQHLTETAYGLLDPNNALPPLSSDEPTGLVSTLQELQFTVFQSALGICESLEERIVDWAKGKSFKPYSFILLPVLTAEEAEKQYNELGKLPSRSFSEPSENRP